MLHLSQWTSQCVQNISMTIRHPLSLDPHIGQGKTSKKNPQFKNGRNLKRKMYGEKLMQYQNNFFILAMYKSVGRYCFGRVHLCVHVSVGL